MDDTGCVGACDVGDAGDGYGAGVLAGEPGGVRGWGDDAGDVKFRNSRVGVWIYPLYSVRYVKVS